MLKNLATMIAGFVLCTPMSNAHQPRSGLVHAMAGPYVYQTAFRSKQAQMDSPWLGGFGFIAEGDINDRGGLEIGLFYLHKLYSRPTGSQPLVEKIKRMYITTGYRRWFQEKYSVAMALFSSYSMGQPQTINDPYNNSATFQTSAKDITEYGLDFSFQWEFYARKRKAILLDARYSLSLTPRNNEDSDHWALMLAFKSEVNIH